MLTTSSGLTQCTGRIMIGGGSSGESSVPVPRSPSPSRRTPRRATDQRLGLLRPSLEVQRIEGQVGGRNLVAHPRPGGKALAKPRIVRPAVVVRGHQLAVDHAAGRYAAGGGHHLGHVRRQVAQSAVLQANCAIRVAEQDAAQAVPLDLEHVLGRAERRFGRGLLHRAHLTGEALELDLKLIRISHAAQIRAQATTKLYDVSWSRPPASPARRAASWPARPTPAGPPSGPSPWPDVAPRGPR